MDGRNGLPDKMLMMSLARCTNREQIKFGEVVEFTIAPAGGDRKKVCQQCWRAHARFELPGVLAYNAGHMMRAATAAFSFTPTP